MKLRIFQDMSDSVFFVLVCTEQWSQDEIRTMCRIGEPEVDLGGVLSYMYDGQQKTKDLGSMVLRLAHGFPFRIGFDSRDYSSLEEAVAAGSQWKEDSISKIRSKMEELRDSYAVLPSEEVIDNV